MAHLRNGEFGRYTTLKEITTTIDNTNNEKDINKIPHTRIIRISEQMYRRIVGHAKKYYKDIEPYEVILENLLTCYEEHNKDRHWYNLDRQTK